MSTPSHLPSNPPHSVDDSPATIESPEGFTSVARPSWSSGHTRATIVTLALLLASLSAFVRDPSTQDSFPFSTFPMFASVRTTPQLAHLVAVRSDGTRYRVPPSALGTDEVMQAHGTIHAASKHRDAARALCEKVAATLRESGPGDLVRLELVRSRFDPIAYFVEPDGPDRPLARRVVTRCSIHDNARSESGPAATTEDPSASSRARDPHSGVRPSSPEEPR